MKCESAWQHVLDQNVVYNKSMAKIDQCPRMSFWLSNKKAQSRTSALLLCAISGI